MSKSLQTILIVIILLVGAAALALTGIQIGYAWNGMKEVVQGERIGISGWQGVKVDPRGYWSGMMQDESLCGNYGVTGGSMMYPGEMHGLMGGFGSSAIADVTPLALDETEAILEECLNELSTEDLILGEIMIFDNHAYAEIMEQDTGLGAMEVLVDPVTKSVYPEPGPNMMWNLKYSPMEGRGLMGGFGNIPHGYGMGGMMGGSGSLSAEMPFSPQAAGDIANEFLGKFLSGANLDEEAMPFYGYYTFHFLRDGEISGMLSVNGYSGEVWVHTWHGTLVEIAEGH